MYTNDEWAVAATGAVHVDNDDNLLKIRDEETEKTLFYGLLQHDQYHIEGPGNLVVTWNDDKTGSECALSFQTQEGMMTFWNALNRTPLPTFENLDILNAQLEIALSKPPQMRRSLVSGVLDEKWIESLVVMVKEVKEEQMANEDERWTKLFKLFKHLVILDPRQVCGRLMRDDVYFYDLSTPS